MDVIISSLVGGIIGLVIGVIFEEPLIQLKTKILREARAIFYRRKSYLPTPEVFVLGKTEIPWLVVDGDGELSYNKESIIINVDNNPIVLPPDIQKIRESIEKREMSKKRKGENYTWNGPLYALERYVIGRTVPGEQMEVIFTLRPTDYYNFLATVMNLDTNLLKPPHFLTIRKKYLDGHDLSQPIPFLANGFGIALVVITGDRKMILTRRHNNVGARPGELDVSVVEGVHPVLDRSSIHYGPDLYKTAIRGAKEELGITLRDDEIIFLGFGVDIQYYQWNVLGVAYIDDPLSRVLEDRSRGTSGKWETKIIEPIDFEPHTVFSVIREEKMWATSIVAIYWALVHEYGKDRVNSMARKFW